MTAPSPAPLAGEPWLTAPASRTVLDALAAAGRPVRFVGGCVRDALLGRLDPGGDLDLATSARPDQVIESLEAARIKVVPTGLAHGTVTAVVDGQAFEITTLREDVACDGRHAEVRFTDDFERDAARRDFTINAMSVDRDGHLFDYFGGRADLARRRVRFVGEAERRVREDYLRILRFFRFFAGYGRPPADPEALAACEAHASEIQRLSGERIRTEMLKLLGTKDPLPALQLMIDSNVLAHVLPATPELEPLRRLIARAPASDPILRLAALLRALADPRTAAQAIGERWRLSTLQAARLVQLAAEPPVALPAPAVTIRRDLYRLGRETYIDLIRLSASSVGATEGLDDALALAADWTAPALPVRGQDLMARGIAEGPALGALLRAIEAWWLERDMRPDRAACLAELDRRLAARPASRPPP